MGGGAGEISLGDHIGRAFRMGDDPDRGICLAVTAQLLAGEALMHLAGAMPGDNLHLGLARDIGGEETVGNHDDRVDAKAFDQRAGGGTATRTRGT